MLCCKGSEGTLVLSVVLLLQNQPHIFGMTASPVNTRPQDTGMKLTQTMQQLERNLDAQIITVINRDSVIAAAPYVLCKSCKVGVRGDRHALKLEIMSDA